MLTTFGLSSLSLLSSSCSISSSFVGLWIQPGLLDSITINNTLFSLKGTCLNGQHDVKYKYIYYNEQTRCKRCIFFIPRHLNALQYRESECFDADDDNSRICASITPDTVLYTLFRDNAESIPCPLDQSWYFKKSRRLSSLCQPKAFHNCFSINTFQISYNNQCRSNTDEIATCFAQFSDGNMNYIISRSLNQQRFICFSYTKTKIDEKSSLPNEVYLSEDETCRGLLTRESALLLNVRSNKHYESNVQMPDWTQGIWLSTGIDRIKTNSFHINQSQLTMNIQDNQIISHNLKFLRIVQRHEKTIRIRAKSLDQCSPIFYCIKLIYRSSAVVDLSIGFDKHQCQENHIHYTLYKPLEKSNSSCPHIGVYKSLNTYRSSLPFSACSTGIWTLSIGCQPINPSELSLASYCRHELVPDVQVITSIKGICLASWRTDRRFQRTMVLYDKSKAFCLIQTLRSMTTSFIASASSCTNIEIPPINVENSLRYSDSCHESSRSLSISASSSSSIGSVQRVFYLLFYLAMKLLIYM
ncbi:unnamed protein product [Rotaria magnacalcarata]|uniref:Uncharacterized protein n=1 Tax=Rotaria magnacalcarata TaxID=392030 RepID=A0A816XJR7_9BILA|nr:unnamed protein product [Rotaria magnacalcarata]CAF3976334.1 unnamed protein product [Rotaria magnacalcarata]